MRCFRPGACKARTIRASSWNAYPSGLRVSAAGKWTIRRAASLSPAAERLLAAASVVLRLQTLSKAFAEELASQKRQAVYNFAYGLSHELNNPLANIATRAGVLAQAESNVQRRQMLEAILENAMRGSEMLGDLMLLARPPAIVRATTPAVEFLDALVTQANAWAAKRSVEISLRQAYDGPLLIDAVAMREAIWALLRNAIEAMPDGGIVHMQTTAGQQGQQGWCVMEIIDQGVGLSAQALEHCFDPYYSGREAGRGLGLGLGKAQRIIDMHQGRLTLANLPGFGCKARIELPVPARDL